MGTDAPNGTPIPAARGCPICGKPSTRAAEPFCSTRCANVDLHRWLGGVYAVPANEADDESDRSSEDEA
jgi:endogenous inhibitor of DNA gyrase (YacG/DUF329 family)